MRTLLEKYPNSIILSVSKERIINNTDKLINFTQKTFQEAYDMLFGSYDQEALIDYALRTNKTLELAKILLDNSLINDELKKEVLLFENKYYLKPFKNFFKGKVIIINDFDGSFVTTRVIEELSKTNQIIYREYENDIYLNVFVNRDAEVMHLFEMINHFLKNGIDPENIKIYYKDDEYYPILDNFSKLNKIDLTYTKTSILGSYIIRNAFLTFLDSHLDETIDDIIPLLEQFQEYEGYNALINVINDFVGTNIKINKIKHLIKESIYKKTIPQIKYKNSILVGNINYICENDYLFILGATNGDMPSVIKDDGFYNDKTKEALGIPTSIIQNKYQKKGFVSFVKMSKETYLSYPLEVSKNIKKPIDVFKDQKECKMMLEELVGNHLFEMSLILDNYFKYGKKPNRSIDRAIYDKYMSYDNRYNGKYIPKKIRLSYSAIEKYNTCSFKFYLENILRIKKRTNEENIFIGNLMHKALENNSLNPIYEYIEGRELSNKEKFYMNKYLDFLEKFMSLKRNTNFTSFAHEKMYTKIIDGAVFEGKIDHILRFNDKVIVVDYKSGSFNSSLDLLPYGLNMQLLIYFLLVKDDFNPVGGYFVGIMPPSVFQADNKTYDEKLREFFKYDGFTLEKEVKFVDEGYEEKSFLKGIKVKKDGEFDANSQNHLLKENELDKLLDMVVDQISKAINRIKKGDFTINPKTNAINSCEYCQYKDICYRKMRDYVEIEASKKMAFLRGEDDEKAC